MFSARKGVGSHAWVIVLHSSLRFSITVFDYLGPVAVACGLRPALSITLHVPAKDMPAHVPSPLTKQIHACLFLFLKSDHYFKTVIPPVTIISNY